MNHETNNLFRPHLKELKMEKESSDRLVTIKVETLREPSYVYKVSFPWESQIISFAFRLQVDALKFREFIKTASIREVSCVEL